MAARVRGCSGKTTGCGAPPSPLRMPANRRGSSVFAARCTVAAKYSPRFSPSVSSTFDRSRANGANSRTLSAMMSPTSYTPLVIPSAANCRTETCDGANSHVER